MKLLCETQTAFRNQPDRKPQRAKKSTVALGFRSLRSSERDNNNKEMELVHFEGNTKMGKRYKLRDNIEKMFTKFLEDGKVTISFHEPPENLMIKCDPIQLKAFMKSFQLAREGKMPCGSGMPNIAGMQPIKVSQIKKESMVILDRSQYPTQGFPRTLKSLVIAGIEMNKITFQICSLRNLTSLDISHNNITVIPKQMGRLSIAKLVLSSNKLGELNSWDWLKEKNIQASLRELDLSDNELQYFVPFILKCNELVCLKLSNNAIGAVPFGLRRLKKLRHFYIASNRLESLPSIFNNIRLDVLDIWGNNFKQIEEYNLDADTDRNVVLFKNPLSLWLMTARVVHRKRLPYSPETLPRTLIDFLLECPECACGNLCYGTVPYKCLSLATFGNVNNVTFSRDRLTYVDSVLCGSKCLGRRHVMF